MTDATPAETLAATASDTAAAAPRNPEDTTLLGKLSAALAGIADLSEQGIGSWSDEPLRLADFIA